AQVLGAAIIPGSVYLVVGDDRLQEYAAVFDRSGNLIGEQAQTHALAPAFAVSDELTPIAVDDGVKIGLLVGRDAWYPEASRILALSGADILVAPLAPLAPYPSTQAMCGLWQEVQQNQTFGVEAGLAGALGGREYAGRAAVLGPCEITPDESGFLPQPGYFVGNGALAATLRADELRRIRREYPIFRHLNPGLYRKHFPMLYRRPR
ncbi:Nitrilase/cyanide hydratase and apolipoprotein N-acyltransferase, partial [mine drainage metagenome]